MNHFFAQRSFRTNITILFGLIGLLVAVLAGFGHYEQLRSAADNRNVAHTYEVLDSLDNILSALQDAETGQRGFVITGQAAYLAPYMSASERIDDDLSRLRSLTSDNPRQRKRIPRLESLTRSRMMYLATFIEMRQQQGFEAARQGIQLGQGKRAMDELRRVHKEMQEEEMSLLDTRRRKAQASLQSAQVAGAAGTFTIFVVLVLIYYLIRSEGNRRQHAESQLRFRHDEDVKRVQELEGLRSEMQRINVFGEMLQNCMNPEEAYDITKKTLPKFFPNDSGALSLVNASRNIVELKLSWGTHPSTEVFAPEECWGLRRGRTHIIDDPRSEVVCPHISATGATDGEPPAGSRENLSGMHLLCQPMMAHGETLGVFQLIRSGDTWNESEKLLAITLSEMIGVAVANLHLQEALRLQSIRDPLTGLFNRRYMEAALEQEIARSQRRGDPVGVMMLDVDHFKRFNDTFGHEAGDALLAQVGSCLQSQMRKEDIVCRYGGEEFLIIVRQGSLDLVQARAEQIRQSIKGSNPQYRGQSLGTVTISIGIAAYPQHGDTPEEVVRAADAALYQAKRGGRDRVVLADAQPVAMEDMTLKAR